MARKARERVATLTGAQIDALLAVDEQTLRAALQRLRGQTPAPDPADTAAAIVDLITAPTADERVLGVLGVPVPDRRAAARKLLLEPDPAGVQADDDGEA